MRVLYVGCNLFGQITDSPLLSFENFHKFEIDELEDFAIGHSVIVLKIQNDVYLHGHGLEHKKTHKRNKINIPTNGEILSITCSDTRIFFLDNLGELFVLDFLDKTATVKHKQNILLRNSENRTKIVQFQSSVGINVALTECGALYNVPNQLDFRRQNITQISCGNEHCVLLDSNGNVYSFGSGRRGQLGHGSLEEEEEPHLIDALCGIKIVYIECGSWHSCALSKDGDVYIWGWNSDGQLGLFVEEENKTRSNEIRNMEQLTPKKTPVSISPTPTLLDFGLDIKISKLGCGSRHSIFVSENLVMYGCGCNKFNQLGLPDRCAIYEAREICSLEKNQKVSKVVCGPAATALLLE